MAAQSVGEPAESDVVKEGPHLVLDLGAVTEKARSVTWSVPNQQQVLLSF